MTLTRASKRAPYADRGLDVYQTPSVAVEALLRADGDRVPQFIWEPACGPGSIVRALKASGRAVWATDVVRYSGLHQDDELDFLRPGIAINRSVKGIVTNPPFMHANDFVRLACERVTYVAMLLRLAYLEGAVRRPAVMNDGTLARVYVFENRLPMMHRNGWTGPKASNPTAYAWYIFERGHVGPAELHRIAWVPA